MSSELAIVTGYVILNAVLAVPFMLAARADFQRRGKWSLSTAVFSGLIMHGHFLATVVLAWLDRGSLFEPNVISLAVGSAVFLGGAYVIVLGRLAYGSQERVYGLLEDTLIQHGIYERTRNPQYVGYAAMFFGSTIVAGSGLAALAAFSFVVVIHLFITWVEEPHMRRRFGEAFDEYSARVGRYGNLFPGLSRHGRSKLLGAPKCHSTPVVSTMHTTTKKTHGSDHQDFTPALGSSKLTPIYDSVIALLTRERVWRSRVVSAVSPHLVGRVLDVGCGTGSLAIALARDAERSVTIYGLDPDPEVLLRAKRKANAVGLKVRLHNGFFDREFLDRNGPFNVVLSTLVLHQTPLAEKRRILGLAYEALVDGGHLVIADYGLQATPIMRFLFRHTVQRIDGVSDTQPNADGVLPKLIKDA